MRLKLAGMSNEAEWASRIAAWRESGLSAAEFCADKEYPASALYWRARKLGGKGPPKERRSRVPMARVIRRAGLKPAPQPIVVQIGRVRVEVAAGADHETLAQVLRVLADGLPGEGR